MLPSLSMSLPLPSSALVWPDPPDKEATKQKKGIPKLSWNYLLKFFRLCTGTFWFRVSGMQEHMYSDGDNWLVQNQEKFRRKNPLHGQWVRVFSCWLAQTKITWFLPAFSWMKSTHLWQSRRRAMHRIVIYWVHTSVVPTGNRLSRARMPAREIAECERGAILRRRV